MKLVWILAFTLSFIAGAWSWDQQLHQQQRELQAKQEIELFQSQQNDSSVMIVTNHGGTGTGFVINEAGCVLTAAHVVNNADQFIVDRPGSIPRIHYIVIATADKQTDLAVLCPLAVVHPKGIAVLSNKLPVTNTSIHVFGYYINTGHFVSRSGKIVDFITEDMGMFIYTNAPRFSLNEGEFIRTGFSGSPLISDQGVVGLVAVCYLPLDPEKLWLCTGPNSLDLIHFLKNYGIKFQAT